LAARSCSPAQERGACTLAEPSRRLALLPVPQSADPGEHVRVLSSSPASSSSFTHPGAMPAIIMPACRLQDRNRRCAARTCNAKQNQMQSPLRATVAVRNAGAESPGARPSTSRGNFTIGEQGGQELPTRRPYSSLGLQARSILAQLHALVPGAPAFDLSAGHSPSLVAPCVAAARVRRVWRRHPHCTLRTKP
jgi:hypothetical protein